MRLNQTMYAKLGLSTLLLHLVILLGSSEGGDNHMHHVHSSHPHHHHDTTTTDPDPSLSIFFFPENLKPGNTMKIYFPKRELSDSLPHLLSKQEAETLPFSSQKLPQILRLFSFPSSSPQATAIAATLEECDRPPIPGEQKFCATSSQSMSEFLNTIFGPDTPTKAVSTYHIKRSESDDVAVQSYGIVGVRRISSPKMVSCHTMPYAYTVFYCHYHESDNRVYRVSLAGENGDGVEAIAVCHMDTSQWGANHVAFGVLGVGPGSTPVCHFFPADNFVWVSIMSEQI